jgi:ketopantoate reductase
MRILMVGAGAVGAVLTRALEAVKGHDVTYFVRDGRRAQLARVKLLDARSGALHVRERPSVVEASLEPLPHADTVILAVRAEQLDAALDVAARVPGAPRIATASAGFDDLPRVRARFAGRAAVQIVPMFMAYPEGDVIKWWNPPLARTLVSDEHGDDAARAFGEELAAAFAAGGLPSRALRTIAAARDAVLGLGMPLLAGLELAGWDVGAFAGDGELRKLASRGVRDGLRAMVKNPLAAKLIALTPTPLVGAALRVTPALVPRAARDMWRVHGPKIAAQTRALLDAMIARADERGGADGLRELRRRLERAQP